MSDLVATNGEVIEKIIAWREDPILFVREVFQAEPDQWQAEVLRLYQQRPRLAMSACKGPGKAESKENVIETPTGPRVFGSLKVGDLVFAQDGSPTRVTGVYDRGMRPVYRVLFDDGSSATVCGEHLWKVRGRTERRHGTWAVLSTKEIIARGVREKNGRWAGRHFEIPRQGPVQYPRAKIPIDAYVLGVWLGDGCRNTGSYATKPTDEIEQEINRRGYVTTAYPERQTVTVHDLWASLRRLGILDKHCYEKSIPELYKRGDVQQRRDLLCGLMDTDGEIGDDGHIQYASTSETLAEDIIWLARSLGGVAYQTKPKEPFYYDEDRNRVAGRTCYRVTLNLPFNPFLVPHRRERWKDPARSPSTIRYMTRRIDRIEEAGQADCMCIQVEHPDRLYLTNDFIVTHNSTCLAWIGWHFMFTRENPKVVCTSISEANLRDGLWAEMSKWQAKSRMLVELFDVQKTRIQRRDNPELAFMSFRTWNRAADPETIASTLAGLHGEELLSLVDESGGIPPGVLREAEGTLSTGLDTHIVQAGNPISRDGALYMACVRQRHLWHVVEITSDPDEPKRTPRVDREWAREQIALNGRDHPWVQANILGRFPTQSLETLITEEEVREAMQRTRREDEIEHAPRVLGVDTARFGVDASVIFPRQGLVAFTPLHFKGLDTQRGLAILSRKINEWHPEATFIDDTGGYGAGWVDGARTMGHSVVGVHFSNRPADPRYLNKRAEMYFLMTQWIRGGGQLPRQDELIAELCEPQYSVHPTTGKFIIEDKDQVKTRIGRSPDFADALALTFAMPVASAVPTRRARFIADYNPFAEMHRERAD